MTRQKGVKQSIRKHNSKVEFKQEITKNLTPG